MQCPSLRDVRLHSHLAPAAIMFVATVLVSVQGKTIIAVQFGIILFLQVLFSVASLVHPDSAIHHDVAYIAYLVSFAYGSCLQYGLDLLGPHGALVCLAFASMTAHYTCIKLFDNDIPVVTDDSPTELDAL